MKIIVDWLQFTHRTTDPHFVISEILKLGITEFKMLEKGKLGYKNQLFFQNIFVLFDGNDNMGVHTIITGKGCRIYENIMSIENLIKTFDNNIKITRIDLAIDDESGNIIKIDNIIDDIKKGNTVSKWRTSVEITKRDVNSGKILGKTISLGSRASDIFMRIYDKSLEQMQDGNWVRMELEIKGDKAENLRKLINKNQERMGAILKKIINNYIRIVEPNLKDKNKSRWYKKAYWEKIIDTTEKISLSSKKEEVDLEDLKNWIELQVAPSLATIVHAEGGSVDFLYQQIRKGADRLTKHHKKIIDDNNK